MAVDLQKILDSPLSLKLVFAIGRGLPLRLGHYLADRVADRIAARRQALVVRGVRANQWVIRGESLEKDALDLAVRETLRESARCIFDLYHFIDNPDAIRRLMVLDPAVRQLIQRPEFDRRGLVVTGVHAGNFDLCLQWMCREGMRPLVLTIADPQGGRRMEFEMRKKTGMNLVPASIGAMRQALRHLQQGGVVLTGIDRPIPEPGSHPRFFGRPAALPMHHIFLALKARVPVMVLAARSQPDGKCYLSASELVEMDPYPDRETEALLNAEKVLFIAEGFIRQAPEQWSMSLPVWPEALDLVPA